VSIVSSRREFVMLASRPGANVRALCRRFGVSPTNGYKWLKRFRAEGEAGLKDRSRRPRHMPARMPGAVEAAVVRLRRQHPCWGGRKLARRLRDQGEEPVPSPSTITAILHRHALIDAAAAARHRPLRRFERAAPNELWQMDFKGHFAIGGGRCHPLTVLDDHSRFAVVLKACADERSATVQEALTASFRRYGLPEQMLMDNGAPWGCDERHAWTPLTVWLLRLGIAVSHGRPYHPQTQGKDERFHRTLKAEAIGTSVFRDLAECQRAFDAWRELYNLVRPHQALELAAPVTRYAPSPRGFPEILPPIEYAPDVAVRRVQRGGRFSFAGREWTIAKAFAGYAVALRPAALDGCYDVLFSHFRIAGLDLREAGR
jgi:transposase InsO family protein